MPFFQEHRDSGLAGEGGVLYFSPFVMCKLTFAYFLPSFSPAFGYGLLCLGMAYISSQMGPVLQVRTMQRRN